MMMVVVVMMMIVMVVMIMLMPVWCMTTFFVKKMREAMVRVREKRNWWEKNSA